MLNSHNLPYHNYFCTGTDPSSFHYNLNFLPSLDHFLTLKGSIFDFIGSIFDFIGSFSDLNFASPAELSKVGRPLACISPFGFLIYESPAAALVIHAPCNLSERNAIFISAPLECKIDALNGLLFNFVVSPSSSQGQRYCDIAQLPASEV